MAKILLVCSNSILLPFAETTSKIEAISQNIIPEIITPNSPFIDVRQQLAICVSNPVKSLKINEDAICLGRMIGEENNWAEMGSPIPDGNFALFRYNDEKIEAATDILGSRHIWYYWDQNIFIASSSQRAIIQYLGSFEVNDVAFSWMVSVGSLTQGVSWDKRIKFLPVNSKLTLNRKDWNLSLEELPFEYELSLKKNENEISKEYSDILKSTLGSQKFDPKEWVLPLSGGYDSRALLQFLPDSTKLKSITWGEPNSINKEYSDIGIAKKLARHFNLEHSFLPISHSIEPLETVVDRFIRYSEGLTDNFAGYLDGFQLWKRLFEEGFSGYIRGDRAFFSFPNNGEEHIIDSIHIADLDLYENGKYLKKILPKQIFPHKLLREKGEPLASWRMRLIQGHFIPCYLGALTECKSGFLETANPILNKKHVRYSFSIVENVKSIHKIYRNLIKREGPNIPVANQGSNISLKSIVRSKDLVEMMKEEFLGEKAEKRFPSELFSYLLDSLEMNPESLAETKTNKSSRLKSWIKSKIPKHIRKKKDQKKTYSLDLNRVAFRVFIILKTVDLLERDAKIFQKVAQ